VDRDIITSSKVECGITGDDVIVWVVSYDSNATAEGPPP
jgi:hypothetical protein